MQAVLAATLALALVLGACGAEAAAPDAAAAPNPVQAVLTNADWQVMHARADDIQGRRVELRARVYRAREAEGDEMVFFAWVDFDNDRLSTGFRMRAAPKAVMAGAFVWVNGVVDGLMDRPDPRGDADVQPLVRVERLLVTDRIGMRPAVRVLQVVQTLEQLGVRVTLERIEFATEETRVFFAVQNTRHETVGAFGTGLRVHQGTAEFSAMFSIGPGVPPPRGRVEPGATERGGFQFPPFSESGPVLEIRWRGAWVEEIADQFREWVWVVDPSGATRPEG